MDQVHRVSGPERTGLGWLPKNDCGDQTGGEQDETHRVAKAMTGDMAGEVERLERATGDAVTGENWLKHAADAGQTDAMLTLGHRAREAGDLDGARRWWATAMAAGDANAMAELITLPTPDRRDAEEALAAVSSADVSEVHRFAGRWDGRQLAVIGDHYLATEDHGERVLCLHLVLATTERLGAAARRFVDGAISLDVDDADFLGRWARALAQAHSDGKPHLVADYFTAGSPIVG